jgi:predicted methyltransferase
MKDFNICYKSLLQTTYTLRIITTDIKRNFNVYRNWEGVKYQQMTTTL